jgi:ubiquitin-protein ligase
LPFPFNTYGFCESVLSLTFGHSSSPLNGEAAELWDTNAEEFKKKVLGRHRDVEED